MAIRTGRREFRFPTFKNGYRLSAVGGQLKRGQENRWQSVRVVCNLANLRVSPDTLGAVCNRTIGVNFRKNRIVGWVERIIIESFRFKRNTSSAHTSTTPKIWSETQRSTLMVPRISRYKVGFRYVLDVLRGGRC